MDSYYFGVESGWRPEKNNTILNYLPILIVILIEVAIYLGELVYSVRSAKNKQLRKANHLDECEFLNLHDGFRTGLSYFRTSMFIAYIIAVIIYIDSSQGEQPLEEILLFIALGILVYMVTLMNQRIFIFHSTYFIVGAPFHFLKKDAIIRYEEIEDFKLYQALYSSYYLRLRFKDSTERLFQFSESFVPRNYLIIQLALNSIKEMEKDFHRLSRKTIRQDNLDPEV